MRDSGDGGGSTGTNWYGYDVPQMWAMIVDQQPDPHLRHVAGWRKAYELTGIHLSTLAHYRDRLAEAWPPAGSPAARAYLDQLDALIGSVRQTYDAAVVNYDAFAGATGALSSARSELKKIFDEYAANQLMIEAGTPVPAPGVAPGGAPGGAPEPRPAPLPPPVPLGLAGRQEELTYRARTIMFRLSAELRAATTQIKYPEPYNPNQTSHPAWTADVYGVPPPTTAPVVPVPIAASSAAPRLTGSEPVLVGGASSPTTVAPVDPVVESPATRPSATGVLPPIVIDPRRSAGPTRQVPPSRVAHTAPRGAVPPGIVLGPSQLIASASAPATRPNPVGGVIGQPLGGLSRPVATINRTEGLRTNRPENPWVTGEGIKPVLEPGETQRVDAGPALGAGR